jgi:hypothetical protein
VCPEDAFDCFWGDPGGVSARPAWGLVASQLGGPLPRGLDLRLAGPRVSSSHFVPAEGHALLQYLDLLFHALGAGVVGTQFGTELSSLFVQLLIPLASLGQFGLEPRGVGQRTRFGTGRFSGAGFQHFGSQPFGFRLLLNRFGHSFFCFDPPASGFLTPRRLVGGLRFGSLQRPSGLGASAGRFLLPGLGLGTPRLSFLLPGLGLGAIRLGLFPHLFRLFLDRFDARHGRGLLVGQPFIFLHRSFGLSSAIRLCPGRFGPFHQRLDVFRSFLQSLLGISALVLALALPLPLRLRGCIGLLRSRGLFGFRTLFLRFGGFFLRRFGAGENGTYVGGRVVRLRGENLVDLERDPLSPIGRGSRGGNRCRRGGRGRLAADRRRSWQQPHYGGDGGDRP